MSFANFSCDLVFSGETRDSECERATGSIATTGDATGITLDETSPIAGTGMLNVAFSIASALLQQKAHIRALTGINVYGYHFRMRRTGSFTADVPLLLKQSAGYTVLYIDDADNLIKAQNSSGVVTMQSTTAVPTAGSIEVWFIIEVAGNNAWLFIDGVQEAYGYVSNQPDYFFKNNGGSGLGADLKVDDMCMVFSSSANDTPDKVQWPRLKTLAAFPIPSTDGDYTAPSTATDTVTADTGGAHDISNATGGTTPWATNTWAGHTVTVTIATVTYELYVEANGTDWLDGRWSDYYGTETVPINGGGRTVNIYSEDGWTGVGDVTNKADNWDEDELPAHDGDTSYNGQGGGVLGRQLSEGETRAEIGLATDDVLFRVFGRGVSRYGSAPKTPDYATQPHVILKGASNNNKVGMPNSQVGHSITATYGGFTSAAIKYPGNPGTDENGWNSSGSPADFNACWFGMVSGPSSWTGSNGFRATMLCLVILFYPASSGLLPLATRESLVMPRRTIHNFLVTR